MQEVHFYRKEEMQEDITYDIKHNRRFRGNCGYFFSDHPNQNNGEDRNAKNAGNLLQIHIKAFIGKNEEGGDKHGQQRNDDFKKFGRFDKFALRYIYPLFTFPGFINIQYKKCTAAIEARIINGNSRAKDHTTRQPDKYGRQNIFYQQREHLRSIDQIRIKVDSN